MQPDGPLLVVTPALLDRVRRPVPPSALVLDPTRWIEHGPIGISPDQLGARSARPRLARCELVMGPAFEVHPPREGAAHRDLPAERVGTPAHEVGGRADCVGLVILAALGGCPGCDAAPDALTAAPSVGTHLAGVRAVHPLASRPELVDHDAVAHRAVPHVGISVVARAHTRGFVVCSHATTMTKGCRAVSWRACRFAGVTLVNRSVKRHERRCPSSR